MSPPPVPLLDESDHRELLRIAMVYAKEWLRSGRKPPGAPHRASLLAPSAAWLRLAFSGVTREALQLSASRPLWETVAALVVPLLGEHPSPTLEELPGVHLAVLALGVPTPLDPGAPLPAGAHLAVQAIAPAGPTDGAHPGDPGDPAVSPRRGALILAEEAAQASWSPDEQLAACCRRAGLPDDACLTGGARAYAFATPSPAG